MSREELIRKLKEIVMHAELQNHELEAIKWAAEDIVGLSNSFRSLESENSYLRFKIDCYSKDICKVASERDEARRNLCLSEAAVLSFGEDGVPYHPSVAHKIAADYGWDCFPNEGSRCASADRHAQGGTDGQA